jgi:hypothetical protein
MTGAVAAAAVAVCRSQHPAEWDATCPRAHACVGCAALAATAIESYLGGPE